MIDNTDVFPFGYEQALRHQRKVAREAETARRFHAQPGETSAAARALRALVQVAKELRWVHPRQAGDAQR